jgi:hypothetical protein
MSRLLVDSKSIIKNVSKETNQPAEIVLDIVTFAEKKIKQGLKDKSMPEIFIPKLMRIQPRSYTIGSIIKYKYLHHLKNRLNGRDRAKSLNIYLKEYNNLMINYLRTMNTLRSSFRKNTAKSNYWENIFNELK